MAQPGNIPGAPCWIDLFSADTDKIRDFYGQVFGWASEDAGTDYGGYINFSKDGKAVGGCMANDGSMGVPDHWTVYLSVADINATAAVAAEHGGQVIVPPMEVAELGHMAVVTDPGGAGIGMWQASGFSGFEVVGEPGTPDWFELHTRDFGKSVSFYEDVYGWDAHAAADTPEFRYTTLGEGDGQLAGIMDASAWVPDGQPAEWSVYFATSDVDASLAKITDLGGGVVTAAEDTPYGRLATASDPTGSVFKLRG
jgi:predicted enzyme related to lactoylglutathione lyase